MSEIKIKYFRVLPRRKRKHRNERRRIVVRERLSPGNRFSLGPSESVDGFFAFGG